MDPKETKGFDPEELKKLMEMDADGDYPEGLDPDVLNKDPESDDEKRRQAQARAFAEQRKTIKSAQQVIQELVRTNSELQERGGSPSGASGGDDNRRKIDQYEQSLTQRAMQNLGVDDPELSIVERERQRIYEEDVQTARRTREASGQAGQVQDTVLSEFSQLGDEDKQAIRDRLKNRPALEQASEEAVRSAVHQYLGENFSRFSGNGSRGDREEKENTRAGASHVKSRGSSGVVPGSSPSQSKPVSPPSAEEAQAMRKLRLDPTDNAQVKIFRNANERKGKYSGVR